MSVTNSSDSLLLLEVAEHAYVLLKYHADECGITCQEFIPVFNAISDKPEYAGVVFLRINVDDNPVAKKYILQKKQPIVTAYLNGSIFATVQTSSAADVESLLDKLLSNKR